VASLSHVFGSTPSSSDVYNTWAAWSKAAPAAHTTPRPPDPTWVLGWYLGIDAAFFVVF
jgi:hypothetical protein